MLKSTLQAIVPSVTNTFKKLRVGEAYQFDHWEDDVLYYRVSPRRKGGWNKKSVPVPEIQAALGRLRQSGTFSRSDFEKLCPVASKDGPCGFCVVGRVLEILGVAKFSSQGEGFVLTDSQKADRILM